MKYSLVGSEHSYYSGKVRSYMKYKGIVFDEVQVTSSMYKSLILPLTHVAFIPVLVVKHTDNAPVDVIQDTAAIIDYLEERHPHPSITPTSPEGRFVSSLFELWADEWLVLPAMHYRWSFPEQREFLINEWSYLNFDTSSTRIDRCNAAEKLMQRFAAALPMLGVTHDTIPGVERMYNTVLHMLDEHFMVHNYLLGDAPCRGDFALMGPLYAHLFRDPVPGALMKLKAPRVAEWVERMNGVLHARRAPHTVLPHNMGFSTRDMGGTVGPHIPPSMIPIINHILTDITPVLQGSVSQLSEYIKGTPNGEVPRVIGQQSFMIGGCSGTRMVFPFNVWRLQHVGDTLRGDNTKHVTQWVHSLTSGVDFMNTVEEQYVACRLQCVHNKLYPDTDSSSSSRHAKL